MIRNQGQMTIMDKKSRDGVHELGDKREEENTDNNHNSVDKPQEHGVESGKGD